DARVASLRDAPQPLPRHRERQRVARGFAAAVEIEPPGLVEKCERQIAALVAAKSERSIDAGQARAPTFRASLEGAGEIGVGVIARFETARRECQRTDDDLRRERKRDCTAPPERAAREPQPADCRERRGGAEPEWPAGKQSPFGDRSDEVCHPEIRRGGL